MVRLRARCLEHESVRLADPVHLVKLGIARLTIDVLLELETGTAVVLDDCPGVAGRRLLGGDHLKVLRGGDLNRALLVADSIEGDCDGVIGQRGLGGKEGVGHGILVLL